MKILGIAAFTEPGRALGRDLARTAGKFLADHLV